MLKTFWEALGSKVEVMDAKHHDLVLAITSHVPHLIAYNIVGTADDLRSVTEGEVIKYSAGGFRDFTRIAASDPTMWRDVFLNNSEAVLEVLGRFSEDLSALQRADPLGRRRCLVQSLHPHARHPPRHRRCRPGQRRGELRAQRAGEKDKVQALNSAPLEVFSAPAVPGARVRHDDPQHV